MRPPKAYETCANQIGNHFFYNSCPTRLVLELFPNLSFWHIRELLDLPGDFVQGAIGAALYFGFSFDPSDHPEGIDKVINFLWLYALVYVVIFLADSFLKTPLARGK
jgi:hypothetical protein